MLLSLYVCKLKFVHILLPWEHIYIYTVPYFLSCVPYFLFPLLHWWKFIFALPFMCKALIWLSFPCLLQTPATVGLISVFDGMTLHIDLWLNLVSAAIGGIPVCTWSNAGLEEYNLVLKISLAQSPDSSTWIHTGNDNVLSHVGGMLQNCVGSNRIIPF